MSSELEQKAARVARVIAMEFGADAARDVRSAILYAVNARSAGEPRDWIGRDADTGTLLHLSSAINETCWGRGSVTPQGVAQACADILYARFGDQCTTLSAVLDDYARCDGPYSGRDIDEQPDRGFMLWISDALAELCGGRARVNEVADTAGV